MSFNSESDLTEYVSTVGQIPVLYEEGKPELSQSQVISRYLAKKFGLTGDNDWEDARLDEVISLVYDLFICKEFMGNVAVIHNYT